MYEQSTYNFKLNCKVKEKQQYHQSKKKKKKEKNKSLKSGEAQTDTKNHSFILQISLCPFLNSTNPDPFFYVKKKKKAKLYNQINSSISPNHKSLSFFFSVQKIYIIQCSA